MRRISPARISSRNSETDRHTGFTLVEATAALAAAALLCMGVVSASIGVLRMERLRARETEAMLMLYSLATRHFTGTEPADDAPFPDWRVEQEPQTVGDETQVVYRIHPGDRPSLQYELRLLEGTRSVIR